MIPINTLVRDGCWLKCTARSKYVQSELTFRMRILSFEQLDYPQMDRPLNEQLTPIESGAVLWLMKLEVVNLSKISVLFGYLTQEMRVVDSDGFEFEGGDGGLYFSDFGRRIGLSLGLLSAKLKAQGAVIFKVPDEDTEYSLTLKDGTVEEI